PRFPSTPSASTARTSGTSRPRPGADRGRGAVPAAGLPAAAGGVAVVPRGGIRVGREEAGEARPTTADREEAATEAATAAGAGGLCGRGVARGRARHAGQRGTGGRRLRRRLRRRRPWLRPLGLRRGAAPRPRGRDGRTG